MKNGIPAYYSTIWKAQNPPDAERAAMGERIAADPRLQSVMKVMGFSKQVMTEEHFQGRFTDKEFMEKVFDDHHEEAKRYVPADKLLVYDVTEGWEPLCKFLGVEVPSEPLPHTNKKEDFHEMVKELFSGNLV